MKQEMLEKEAQVMTEDKTARTFIKSFWTRMEFVWRIIASTIITSIYISIVYQTSQAHYNFLYNIVKMTNSTSRIELFFGINENLHRTLFYNSSFIINEKESISETATSYEDYATDIIEQIYQVIKILNIFCL